MKSVLIAIAVAFVLLFSSTAKAAGDFSVDLVGAEEHPPQFVCVASPPKPASVDADPRTEGWHYAYEVLGFASTPCADPPTYTKGERIGPTYRTNWNYGVCPRPAEDGAGKSDARRASIALRTPPTSSVIFGGESACRPRVVDLPSTALIRCSYDPSPAAKGSLSSPSSSLSRRRRSNSSTSITTSSRCTSRAPPPATRPPFTWRAATFSRLP